MGKNLNVFLRLFEDLQKVGDFDEPALYIANAKNYLAAKTSFPLLNQSPKLFEWELVNEGRNKRPSREELQQWQSKFSYSLWNVIVADRRLFFGKYCKYKQDYVSRFSEAELQGILVSGLEKIEAFVLKNSPDVIFSFGTATFGDYIFELIASLHNIPFFQLKATKVQNLMHLGNTGLDVSDFLKEAYESERFSSDVVEKAREHLEITRSQGVKYEGAILLNKRQFFQKLKAAPRRLITAFKTERANRKIPLIAEDNHVESPLAGEFYQSVVRPLRTLSILRKVDFVDLDDLEGRAPYIFFPLHFEPEVSIQVFGKSFQNQIEVVRNLALSAPMGTKVLVKEHPRSLGFRKWSYYKKLLDIPNVELVNPFLPSLEIVKKSTLVAVISGSIGLEAVICGKPTLVFGKVPYQMLPSTMVHTCTDYRNLESVLFEVLKNYSYDEEQLVRYFAAIMTHSVPVNFYTKLLNKSNRYSDTGHEGQLLDAQYESLASHVASAIQPKPIVSLS